MSDNESEDEYGTTSVLLGYAGKAEKQSNLTALDNHLGGTPIWFKNTPPPEEFLLCDVCKGRMALLTQISCPLDDKDYDRSLYVFSCLNPECRRKAGSVKALRGVHDSEEVRQRIQEELKDDEEQQAPKSEEKPNISDRLFGASGSSTNPFASNPFAASDFAKPTEKAEKPAKKADYADKTETAEKPETESNETSEKTDNAPSFPCKAMDVEEEYLTPEKLPSNVKIDELGDDVLDTSSDAPSAGGSDVPLDAEAAALAASVSDPVFTKFVMQLEHNPEQVLRYERFLKPVPYANDALYEILTSPEKLPVSPVDKKPRDFELQLMPHLISELESDEMLLDGMEWGTIVVATSKTDALPTLDANGVGYAPEWVGVQWEQQQQ